MEAQAARGHTVAYMFAGRHYPLIHRPRLRRWTSSGVSMYELIGSPINLHWDAGTRYPERDLHEPVSERAFAVALREARPDVIHVQELAGLPSSLIEKAKAAGLPVVMSLHDYSPLCATVRLLDGSGTRCMRLDVGEDCARNCAAAPHGDTHLIEETVRYETLRAKSAIPLVRRVDDAKLEPFVRRVSRWRSPAAGRVPGAKAHPPSQSTLAASFQRRRDVNTARLSMCDRLVAPSARVREIYAALGVDRTRIVTQRLTLPHLERLTLQRGPEVRTPLTFIALGAGAVPSKGSRVLLEAVRLLEEAGRGQNYRLIVMGFVEPGVARELDRMPAVTMPGIYRPDELEGVLNDADIGIVPSIWEEAHGFVGIELLAKGLPVIGSALGGIPEYVKDGKTGWLNHTATGKELAAIMASVIDDPAEVVRLRQSVGLLRGELVKPMAPHVDEVERLYGEVIAGS